ncbi:MAG TPA: Hpt domain-containing protein [Spirochaetia bacterium]|nr:Hpt domain-containing protein [Spirochaetia bacterium]
MIVDFHGHARKLELDTSEFRRLLGMFIASTYDDLRTLDEGLERRDFSCASQAIHSVKGAAGMLELDDIYEHAVAANKDIIAADVVAAAKSARALREQIDDLAAQVDERDGTRKPKSPQDTHR